MASPLKQPSPQIQYLLDVAHDAERLERRQRYLNLVTLFGLAVDEAAVAKARLALVAP